MSKTDRKLQVEQEEAGQHLYANRVRVYPKSVRGPVRRFKWAVLAFCLAVYYLLPWLRWSRAPHQPDQAVLLDLWHEHFYFFNLEFWPQDIYYLTGLLIMGAVGLFLVTSLVGRVWCGYTCPQTVWTDLFMWIERVIEGDRNERMKRDAGPITADVVWRKSLKHVLWLGIAFWTGGAWIMYYVDAPTVTVEFWTGTASKEVYFFTFLFTATTYLLAGWAREQVCTYMCPWPRFQSAMLDEQSLTVTYQAWRGEPRTRGKRTEAAPAAASGAAVARGGQVGDCVDCGACVTACPTGIDIRDGIQLECINCGLCIDACNHVMQKTGKPGWLITWDTLADQAAKAAGTHAGFRFFRPRTIIYLSALC
ncbi:MAG: cytochrome c oxidase accessory protein CcoG, partial [Rhodospirillales bacterium]|nr:cytochrome c oxidase accessory protein CcoG [Rhodospirillales bacterium]